MSDKITKIYQKSELESLFNQLTPVHKQIYTYIRILYQSKSNRTTGILATRVVTHDKDINVNTLIKSKMT